VAGDYLLFRDFNDFAVLVKATMRADAMGQPQFVAVRALSEGTCRQTIVCTPPVTAAF